MLDYAFGDPGSYQVVVKITNSGTTHGSATQTQVVVVDPAPVPSAPRGVSVVPGDESAKVAWTAPASAGSAAITGYTVTASPGGATCTTPGLGCVVSGLTNQKPYTFKVVARNSVGVSPAATSAAAIPQPAASVKVKAKNGKSKLLVDVNPNMGDRSWVFELERKRKDGSWKSLDDYRTEGAKEKVKIDLKKGKYRVVVDAKFGYRGVTSEAVKLKD